VIERFSVQIASSRPALDKALREKAATRIYQAALLHRVAVLLATPRGFGTVCRSVIVADIVEDKVYVDRVCRDNPLRLVGVYQLENRATHRQLLTNISEDIEEAARGVD
jgi:hypothetical protein